MLTRFLTWLGFQLTADVWEANERLKAKLSLAEKRLAAAAANANLMGCRYNAAVSVHNTAVRKYQDACLRIIELEAECNEYAAEGGMTHPYPQKGG